MNSQINDDMLDQAFTMPIGPSFERLLERASVKNIGHKRNNVWALTDTWME